MMCRQRGTPTLVSALQSLGWGGGGDKREGAVIQSAAAKGQRLDETHLAQKQKHLDDPEEG